MSSQPLVSCIMPTANRRAFVPQAMAYFQRQDYTATELIVVDDGGDAIGDLIPADERIRHIRLNTKMTVGAKRNLACEEARGEIIAHWDEDDWRASHRLRHQVEALLRSGADVCGITTLLFYNINTGRAWRYVYPADQRFWLSGSTLCYRRAFWARHSFTDVSVGEDVRFIWCGRPEHMVVLPESTFHVGIIHGRNVAPKHTEGPYWHPYAVEEIRRLLGQAWRFYRLEVTEIADGAPCVSPALAAHVHERSIGMITVAREADMALPEYGALNHGQALPWMRRWEIPFALFQARLTTTMAVLDCTINPVGFQERLTRLYPHVLYRHWNPIQSGQFALPFGVPDAAFDRVICINTLEHLLKSQREALIAIMARKLKPGSWVILTSDYYFDAFWSQPAFLRAGVMRADRSEILNGWNKVTPQEWFEICRRYELHPMAETVAEPREDDAGLYRQRSPYPHACIAGVFCKTPRAEPPGGKKIVLALLAWNTRDVTMDSVRAHVREARMLRRLGQEPFLCVCDNGSTDGLADALRAFERHIDVPLLRICRALHDIAHSYHHMVHILYPVHLNPQVWEPVHWCLSAVPGITLVPPLDYLPFVQVLKRSYLVLTDSGGLQEEAPSLGKPVLVLRLTTERPEAVEAGTVKLIGPSYQTIVRETACLLEDAQAYQRMARAVNPYGDGHAARRIVAALLAGLEASKRDLRPAGCERSRPH